jgi:hypothetical protein
MSCRAGYCECSELYGKCKLGIKAAFDHEIVYSV